MIVKNITFVVPVKVFSDFERLAFTTTDKIADWVDEIRLFKLMEQVDQESLNYAIQLSFSSEPRLIAFNQLVFNKFITDLQEGFSEKLLYFESHLQKVF